MDNELKRYATENITEQYEVRQSDIGYKKHGEEIYYIIEHQSTVDLNMPYRMLRYCMELMRKIIETSNHGIYPTIVPIVIYTGERRWTAVKNFADKQAYSKEEYKAYKINMKYKLIDINKISTKKLLIKQSYIASIMLIEKSKTKEEMVTNIKKVIENTKDIKQLKKLKNYIIYIQKDVLKEKEEEILEMISRRVGNDQMSTLIERLRKENDAIRKEAKEEARKELREEARKEAREEVRIEKETIIKSFKEEMLKNGETEEKVRMYIDILMNKMNLKKAN